MTDDDRTQPLPLFRQEDGVLMTFSKIVVLLALIVFFVVIALITLGILLGVLVDVWRSIW